MSKKSDKITLSAEWIVGFIDRSASFFVVNDPKKSYRLGRRIRPEFRIVQSATEQRLLEAVMAFFHAGHIRKNSSGQYEYRIRDMAQLNQLVTFLRAHPLKTAQRDNVLRFEQILTLLEEGEHLTERGFRKMIDIARPIMKPARRGIRG